MFNSVRISGYYVIERKRNWIWVSHLPRWLIYFADHRKFFRERKRAYQKIAELLENEGFWGSIDKVKARSFTIDFSREIPLVHCVKPSWYDKPGLVMLWMLNLYNWNPFRFSKFIQMMRRSQASEILIERQTFINTYRGGE